VREFVVIRGFLLPSKRPLKRNVARQQGSFHKESGSGVRHPSTRFARSGPGKPGGFLTLSGRSLNFSTLKAKTAFAYNVTL